MPQATKTVAPVCRECENTCKQVGVKVLSCKKYKPKPAEKKAR